MEYAFLTSANHEVCVEGSIMEPLRAWALGSEAT